MLRTFSSSLRAIDNILSLIFELFHTDQYPIILPFHTVHRVLKARILKCLPFPSPVDHILPDLSTMTRSSWIAPWAWLSFFELDKAVVLVWLDWLISCEYGSSVSALWCSLATPTIVLGFLLPCVWCISSRLLQQRAATANQNHYEVSFHASQNGCNPNVYKQ